MTQIQLRRGLASLWASTNPVLGSGEQGLETDTKRLKMGDGVTAWNSLAYVFDTTSGNLKADLLSPALTGNPVAPTPTPGDNDTSIATTAFVTGAISTQHTADLTSYNATFPSAILHSGRGCQPGPPRAVLGGLERQPDAARPDRERHGDPRLNRGHLSQGVRHDGRVPGDRHPDPRHPLRARFHHRGHQHGRELPGRHDVRGDGCSVQRGPSAHRLSDRPDRPAAVRRGRFGRGGTQPPLDGPNLGFHRPKDAKETHGRMNSDLSADAIVKAIWNRWEERLRDWDLEGSVANQDARDLAVEVVAEVLAQ